MITYYFIFSFVASVLLVILDLGVYKNPFNICTLLIIGFTAASTAVFYAYKTFPKLTRLTGVTTVLFAIPVLCTGSIVLFLAVCNFPPTKSFPEKLPLQLPSVQENAAYIQRNLLFETKSKCFIATTTASEKSTLFSTKCIEEREHILTILSNIRYAPPLQEQDGEIYLSWDTAWNPFYIIRDIYIAEFVRIDRFLNNNDPKSAQEIYCSLWRVVTNILKSKNNIVDAYTITDLIEMLLTHHEKFWVNNQHIKETILNQMRETATLVDSFCAESFVIEYAFQKSILFVSNEDSLHLSRWNLAAMFKANLYKWPFLDKYASLQFEETMFASLIQLVHEKSDNVDQLIADFDIALDKTLQKQTSRKNPFGTYIQQMSIPRYTAYIKRKNRILKLLSGAIQKIEQK